mmetsp:Transcript_32799/g.56072  ORF Transcript_32799/g.56072 Transcript_32799/m.56072 type:complete len:251 (+) Transcript_32799:120-872(+)
MLLGRVTARLRASSAASTVHGYSTLHKMLKLQPTASPSELRRAYLANVKRLHPDVHGSGSSQQFVALQGAWDTYQRHRAQNEVSQQAAASGDAVSSVAQEMVLLVISCDACDWTSPRLHSLRHATTRALDLALHGEQAADVRRIERKTVPHGRDRLDLHIGASSPRHREALVAAMRPRTAEGRFQHLLRGCLDGSQFAPEELRVDECLHYSWVCAPPPVSGLATRASRAKLSAGSRPDAAPSVPVDFGRG